MTAVPVRQTEILDRLGEDIVAGRHPIGSALTLDSIQVRFGVSRTVARDVMLTLENLGLVDARRRVGLVVQPMTSWAVLDRRVVRWRAAGPAGPVQSRAVHELRRAVLPTAAAAAARHADDREVVELGALARRIEAGHDVVAHAHRFFDVVLAAGRNDLIAATGAVIRAVQSADHDVRLRDALSCEAAARGFGAVALAVQDRGAGNAERAMRDLVEATRT